MINWNNITFVDFNGSYYYLVYDNYKTKDWKLLGYSDRLGFIEYDTDNKNFEYPIVIGSYTYNHKE